MRDRVTTLIAIVLLAAVTVTSYFYSRQLRWSTRIVATPAEAPDLVANRIALTEFDSLGRARLTLFADSMVHRSDTDVAMLQAPRLVSRRPDQPQLEARARVARVEEGGATIDLEDDVVLTRDGAAGQPPLRLTTEFLQVLPDDDRYRTDRPVLLERGASRESARGMDLDNVARTVVFDADVHGTFEAAPHR
ncbi:MAG TPA: LPS export ABC transporter periplasmic protein LptC [Burkholderiaceae bacterium]|nr:LPS export ABC transporter periplasmic protein LptC [Burkholderiaceae bacterium]